MSTVSLNLINDSITANFYIEGTTAGPTVGNVALLNLDGNASNVLKGDGTWGVGGGGNASVAGADTELQYNNAGALGAITGVTSNGVAITAAIANIKITGGANSQFISTDGYGNLAFSTIPGYVQTPRVELIAPAVSTQNYTWTHPSFAYYNDDATLMNIFSMGVLTDKDKWSLSGTTLTYNAWTLPNGQYDVLPGVVATGAASGSIASADTINANIITANSVTSVRLAGEGGNISNIQTPVIANSTTYARTYSDGHFRVAINNGLKMMIDSDGVEITGALVPAANITYDLGTATRRWKDLYLSNNTIYLNDVSLSADANGLSVAGSTMATETFVTNKITEVVGVAPVALDTLSEIANSLNNDANFAGTITNSLANKVAVDDFANYQGVVTDALANKVSTTTYTAYVDGMANTVANLVVVDDFVAYQGDVTTALSTKAAITTVDNALANKASIAYVDNAIANVSVDLTGYATETFVTNEIANIAIPSITGLATETYVDNAVANVSVDLTGYATETFVTNEIANIAIPSIAGLATEDFVGNSINALGNIRTVNLDGNVSNVLAGNGSWVQNQLAGGNTGEIQFNSSNTLSGSNRLKYDGVTLTAASDTVSVINAIKYSNTSSSTLTVYRARGTKATPANVAVNDTLILSGGSFYTGNGAATVDGLVGWPNTPTAIVAKVLALPSANGFPASTEIALNVTSNTSNSLRTMLSVDWSNVSIAGSSANSNVVIASGSANSNVYIAGGSANSNVVIASGSANSNVVIASSSANSNVTIAPSADATIRIGGGANAKIIMYTQNVPATSTSTGTTGQVAFDQNYIYYCVATDTWKRSALATW